ncbi:(d)CMP kinase [Rhodobaculum claviforme]|uniref:Cytidylate kinase n=1 Tax=Rhodobaculum claviforme TaxID=1549854 RepID=A0A934WH06_9RHOB|nr:(d)CMP kinase [Rhodobaculum claviforme]MBK5927195.1 cytidylate kinase [Rhodobaculum claviforme]
MAEGARFTVALDGPAASGKGTLGRALAQACGFAHLDTGLLYRAVGARAAAGEDPVAAARSLVPEDLSRADLRSAAAGQAASRVAALEEVRAALLAFQRDFARRPGGAVLDGRDIGTVVCPGAEVKLFVTASDAVRSRRRWLELRAHQPDLTQVEVLEDLRARDARDRERAAAPLRPAPDAMLLDTSDLTIEAAIARALSAVEAARR